MLKNALLSLALLCLSLYTQAQSTQTAKLPKYPYDKEILQKDWLIEKTGRKTSFYKDEHGFLVLSNGLIARKFDVQKGGASLAIDNLMTGESMLRAIRPEAEVTIDGLPIAVGGLLGQPVKNYISDSFLDSLRADPSAFSLVGFDMGETQPRMAWQKRMDWMPKDVPWPAPGKSLRLIFGLNAEAIAALAKKYERRVEDLNYLKEVQVVVCYEMYDDLPSLSKWIEVENQSGKALTVNRFKSEIVSFTEPESDVDGHSLARPNVSLASDYRFGGMADDNLFESAVAWKPDSAYITQVNYNMTTPVLLEASPKIGPDKQLLPRENFKSFRIWELYHSSTDRERKGLALKKLYRSQAPWSTENPILMHVRSADEAAVKKAIDQCADVGFELVIMTFGSGFNLEDESEANIKKMKALADYAHAKGVALGGYSLLASRSIDKENDVVMPEGQTPRFNHSPCLGSAWGEHYFRNLYDFYEKTGMDVLEHDGSYPGDVCMSTEHPGHRGLGDSQWEQYDTIQQFYEWCRAKGIYLNVPDHFFMAGSNKTGMGYRETNWSLPRAYQEIIERQNVYDGTWNKTPSMGWMFVPLVEYHGGGAAATIEPLKEHLPHYGQRLANLFGAGVQACYRGPEIYDSAETRTLVKGWVDFYKSHREVLDADLVHLRRPDGQDWDGIVHVNPFGKEKGLIMLYNPLNVPVQKEILIDLYYTGLTEKVQLTDNAGKNLTLELDRKFNLKLPISIPANGYQWFVLNEAK
ncbi:alpha-galactosidase [Marinilongibacter aquaticus]|uniref:alpha-galactosidase n=1 Tax=Marinilongibacter aquaticus TaxID=2975157 RepID=UPI0021BD6074|nr:alpha-galactosidase [Marinilongibacter aquaticus]UBM58279.1 alpha-galactosidase [Marinilongibacter aquaticus]